MTKWFYLVNICDIFFIIVNMLKGANLKGGRRPSAPIDQLPLLKLQLPSDQWLVATAWCATA